MAHSVEGRLPFLDHPLVELVNQMPVKMKINGETEKYILREAVKPFITEEIYSRKKHRFNAPPYLTEPNSKFMGWLKDTLHSQYMKNVYWLDQKRILDSLNSIDLSQLSPEQLTLKDSALVHAASYAVLQKHFNVE